MNEIWKDINGYEGIYQISSHGRIKSLLFKNGTVCKEKEKLLRPTDNGRGYLLIRLCKEGVQKNFYIHRLVAEAFVEKIEGKNEINHIDGYKKNNNADNLEWCNRSGNLKHSYKLGTHIPPKPLRGKYGYSHPMSKEVSQYDLNGTYVHTYGSASLASLITGICCASIRKVAQGNQHTAGGYVWKYTHSVKHIGNFD